MRIRTLAGILTGAALLLALASPAAAQAPGPGTGLNGPLLGVGISFLNADGSTGTGLTLDVRGNVFSGTSFDVGIVGDFSFHSHSIDEDLFGFDIDGSERALTLMGGVRITASQLDRVAPFGQVLFGMARASISGDACDLVEDFDESCSDTNGAISFGGGVDVRLNERWNFRGQIDFIKVLVEEGEIATRFMLGVSTRLGAM